MPYHVLKKVLRELSLNILFLILFIKFFYSVRNYTPTRNASIHGKTTFRMCWIKWIRSCLFFICYMGLKLGTRTTHKPTNRCCLCTLSLPAFVCSQLYFEWLPSSMINKMLRRKEWRGYYHKRLKIQWKILRIIPQWFQQGLGFDCLFHYKVYFGCLP